MHLFLFIMCSSSSWYIVCNLQMIIHDDIHGPSTQCALGNLSNFSDRVYFFLFKPLAFHWYGLHFLTQKDMQDCLNPDHPNLAVLKKYEV